MSITADNLVYDSHGLPIYWREVRGMDLSAARFRYIEGLSLDAEDLAVLARYCSYYSGAPVWMRTGTLMDRVRTMVLSDAAVRIMTRDELVAWLQAAWVAQLDPLETRPL